MKSNAWLRARVDLLKQLITSADNDLYKSILRAGKFPDTEFYRESYNTIDAKAKDFSDAPLTDLELTTFNTYFTKHEDHVAGIEKDGSGYLNPVKVVGTMADVEKVLSKTTNEMKTEEEKFFIIYPAGTLLYLKNDINRLKRGQQVEVSSDYWNYEVNVKVRCCNGERIKQLIDVAYHNLSETEIVSPQEKSETNLTETYENSISNLAEILHKKSLSLYDDTQFNTAAKMLPKSQFELIKAKINNEQNYGINQVIRDIKKELDKPIAFQKPEEATKKEISEMNFDEFLNSIRFYRSGGINSYELPNGKKGIGDKTMIDFFKKIYKRYVPTFETETPLSQAASESPNIIFGKMPKYEKQQPKQQNSMKHKALMVLEEKISKTSNENKSLTYSFDEALARYNAGISEDEIKAWVWYQRSFGNPMKGWDKYFIDNNKVGQQDVLIYSTQTTTIKSNTWADLRVINGNTLIGKLTRFEHEYRGQNFIVVKTENNELVFVDKSATTEKKQDFYTDTSILDELVRKRALVYINGEYIPIPYFTFGNMYDRELEIVKDKDNIIAKYGSDIYEWYYTIISNERSKSQLRVENPDKTQRPYISVHDEISINTTKFAIEALSEDLDMELNQHRSRRRGRYDLDEENNGVSLQDAFVQWLDTVKDNEIVKSTKYDILNYYIGNRRFDEDVPKEKQAEIRDNAREECEKLFGEFLATALTYDDQKRLNLYWNRTYNALSNINVSKVPIAFSCSRYFKHREFVMKDAQRDGVAYQSLAGSCCFAYNVGVGKTATLIISILQGLQSGKMKRPLVVVPKATYKKWKREMFGFWQMNDANGNPIRMEDEKFDGAFYVYGILSNTGVTLNDWANLGVDIIPKLTSKNQNALKQPVPENSITLVTYEGFKKIGYSDKLMADLFPSIVEILDNGGENKASSRRDEQKEQSRIDELIGLVSKDTICDIDVLQLDSISVDEAHNFKNVFEKVGKDEDDKRRNLFQLQGRPSDAGRKLFFHTQYIQRKYGRNVILLTATPFTNSPLEIFSMLSFVGYETLKAYNLRNIRNFFSKFILETSEYVVKVDGSITVRPVIKSFQNIQLLQKMLYNHFDYKTAEEAEIVRPCKILFPFTKDLSTGKELPESEKILTYLDMNEEQEAIQQSCRELANSFNPFDKSTFGNVLKAISRARTNALSPDIASRREISEINYVEFVENSPKIRYVMECINSVKLYHEDRGEEISGQVIYANMGNDYFPFIKEYLTKEIGYKTGFTYGKGRTKLDEVEIIESGTNETKKDLIKDAFLSGFVKVIIGSDTILEGIDLQTKSTCLYSLTPDWNPTDFTQLEGRIWRQGNENGYVRIVVPLIKNSIDVFMYQKLEEKQARVNSLWYRGLQGNTLNVDNNIDPEEIKYALFDDVNQLLQMKLDKFVKIIDNEISVAEDNVEMYKELGKDIFAFKNDRSRIIREFSDLVFSMKDLTKIIVDEKIPFFEKNEQKEMLRKHKEYLEKLDGLITKGEQFISAAPQDDKVMLEVIASTKRMTLYAYGETYGRLGSYGVLSEVDDNLYTSYKTLFSKVKKSERQILFSRGLTINDDLGEVRTQLDLELESKQKEREFLLSAENKEKLSAEIAYEVQKRKESAGTLAQMVQKFASFNRVLTYKSDNVDKVNCSIPDVECCPFNPHEEHIEPTHSISESTPEDVYDEKEIEQIHGEKNISDNALGNVDEKDILLQDISAFELLLEMTTNKKEKSQIKSDIDALKLLIELTD